MPKEKRGIRYLSLIRIPNLIVLSGGAAAERHHADVLPLHHEWIWGWYALRWYDHDYEVITVQSNFYITITTGTTVIVNIASMDSHIPVFDKFIHVASRCCIYLALSLASPK